MAGVAVPIDLNLGLRSSQPPSFHDVAKFLAPEGPLQWCFLVLIAGLATSVLLWALFSANEETWRRNWHGGLSHQHGSVHDLSDAVAGGAERLWEILPGILLVLGLLGTFIGLGMALNEAGTAIYRIAQGGTSEAALKSLKPVIDDIGTKFRTSTWGIIAFLAVRAITVMCGWEEKRLRWCIRKAGEVERNHDTELQRKRNDDLRTELKILAQSITRDLDGFQNAQRPVLKNIEGHTKSAQDSLSAFVKAHVASIESIAASAMGMQDASDTMSRAATQLEKSAERLRDVVEKFGPQVTDTLGGLRNDLVVAIGAMQDGFDKNLKTMSDEIAQSTRVISATMSELGGSVKDAMTNVETVVEGVSSTIGKTVQIQEESVGQFRIAASELSENASKMSDPIEYLRALLERQFATMARIGVSVESLSRKNLQTAETNDRIAQDLKAILEKRQSADGGAVQDLQAINGALAKCNATLNKLLAAAEDFRRGQTKKPRKVSPDEA